MKLNTLKVKVEEKKPINLKEIIFKKLRDYQRRLEDSQLFKAREVFKNL